TVFIDWNYGWDMNHFGDHEKLLKSGYEIWGAPAIRSSPDNYFLTEWEKHFKNIRDFIPAAAKMGYRGIVMTSWSTSGQYSPVFESEEEMTEEYAIRHVYPLSGFNMLVAAYAEAIKSSKPLDIDGFIRKYCAEQYGFNAAESETFWRALKTAPYEIHLGKVESPNTMSIKQLMDSSNSAMDRLYSLHPQKNKEEFEHYKVMAEIRTNYLSFHYLLAKANAPGFGAAELQQTLKELKHLLMGQDIVDMHFAELNKNFLYPAEIKEENELRDIRAKLLYDRLSRAK